MTNPPPTHTQTSLKDRSKKTKTIFTLDTPSSSSFLTPEWPEIPPAVGNRLLTALVGLLSSLNDHTASKTTSSSTSTFHPSLLIGPNAVTAHLESLVPNPPSTLPIHLSSSPKKRKYTHHDHPRNPSQTSTSHKRISCLFITRLDSQPSALHAHIPTLCALTSTPLLPLPRGTEAKLVKLLRPGNGRVLMLGVLEGMVGGEEILEILGSSDGIASTGGNDDDTTVKREQVLLGHIPLPIGLQTKVEWQESRFQAIETTVGEPRSKRRRRIK